MKNYVIKVVSYKRSNNSTCNLLKNTFLNWQVFVYKFDPYLKEYLKNYGEHVRIITELEKPNLAKKRQLVLDSSIAENYDYCIMLDDDISYMLLNNESVHDIKTALNYMYKNITKNKKYVALSASYNFSEGYISDYKNICNNSIFNLKEYIKYYVKYNSESKCEDMEFTIDLILKGAVTGRLNELIIKNLLQGGTTNDGLSYRFDSSNRFLIEGEYMKNKYKDLSEVFEYDENHFKMNTEKLVLLLNK